VLGSGAGDAWLEVPDQASGRGVAGDGADGAEDGPQQVPVSGCRLWRGCLRELFEVESGVDKLVVTYSAPLEALEVEHVQVDIGVGLVRGQLAVRRRVTAYPADADGADGVSVGAVELAFPDGIIRMSRQPLQHGPARQRGSPLQAPRRQTRDEPRSRDLGEARLPERLDARHILIVGPGNRVEHDALRLGVREVLR
jgi:hypothetical protein